MIVEFLHTLGRDIDQLGLSAVEDDVAVVVAAARATGCCPTLTDLVADRHAPTAVRERAFGRLALSLARRLADLPVPASDLTASPSAPARPTVMASDGALERC